MIFPERCHFCRGPIDLQTEICPHCAYDHAKHRARRKKLVVILVVGALIVLWKTDVLNKILTSVGSF